MKLQHLCTFIALSSTHAPLLQDRHDRSVALRSDKVMLSLSSSLQGHSDFPTSITVPYGVYPAPGLSQLYPSGVSLRGCTIRFMLRPAALAGIPDWVKPMPLIQWQRPSRHRVGASSARALPHEPAPSLHIQKGN